MKRVTLGAIVVGLLSLTGGCGGTAPPATPTPVPTPANVSVTGTFLLRGDITVAGVKNRSFRDWETVKLNDECHGSAGTGYQDIVSATEVLLLGDGQIVAKTNLGTGVFRTTSGAWPAEKSD